MAAEPVHSSLEKKKTNIELVKASFKLVKVLLAR